MLGTAEDGVIEVCVRSQTRMLSKFDNDILKSH